MTKRAFLASLAALPAAFLGRKYFKAVDAKRDVVVVRSCWKINPEWERLGQEANMLTVFCADQYIGEVEWHNLKDS